MAGTLAGSSDFKFVSRATDFAVRITFDARSTGTLNEQYPTGVIPWGNGTWLGSRAVVAFSGNCTSFAGEGYFVGSFRFQNRLPQRRRLQRRCDGGYGDSELSWATGQTGDTRCGPTLHPCDLLAGRLLSGDNQLH